MSTIKKRFKIISILGGAVLFLSSFLGMVSYYASTEEGSLLLKTAIAGPSRTLYIVNNIIANGYMKDFPGNKASENPVKQHKKENKDNKLSELIFFLMNSIAIASEKKILFILAVFAGIGMMKHLFKKVNNSENRFLMDRKKSSLHYLKWMLLFITPLQKCVECISEKYDMNPLAMYTGQAGKSPRFNLNRLTARFFFALNTGLTAAVC